MPALRRHSATPRRRAESGQAMVEFAMVVPILLTIVFAAIQFGDAYWKYQQLSAATSEGARKAIVSRSDADHDTTIENQVKNAAPNLDPADINVQTVSTWNAGDNVTVTATYPMKITILGATLFDDNLTSSRTMRVEQ